MTLPGYKHVMILPSAVSGNMYLSYLFYLLLIYILLRLVTYLKSVFLQLLHWTAGTKWEEEELAFFVTI